MDKSLGEKFRKAAGSIAGRTEEVVRKNPDHTA